VDDLSEEHLPGVCWTGACDAKKHDIARQ
jgi:hypothetical protein